MSSASQASSGPSDEGQQQKRNLRIIALLALVFVTMGLTLLLFLLGERRRAAVGEYRGLEQLFETQGSGSGGAHLRARPTDRAEGSAELPLPAGR